MSKGMISVPPKGIKNGQAVGQVKKTQAGSLPPGAAVTEPKSVSVRVGAKIVTLDLAVLDHNAIQDVVSQLGSGKATTARVDIGVASATALTPAVRGRFWELYRAISRDGERPVSLRVGNAVFDRPTDWVAAALSGPTDDPDERCRALDLAAHVVGFAFRPTDREVHLDAVLAKLSNLGYSASRCEEIRRNVRHRLREQIEPAGGIKTTPAASGGAAFGLAKLFLNDRYPADNGSVANDATAHALGGQNVGAAAPTYQLRYYQELFYRRRAGSWAAATTEDVRLEVTSFLQNVAPDRTGVRHVADVFGNVKALCAVRADGDPPLPFHLADPGRRMLALRNGLVDLTALARGKRPRLRPHDPDWFSTARRPYDFDPAADCPRFKAFVGQVLNADPKTLTPRTDGDNRARVVQELMGYSLLTDNRFQTFAIFTGPGRNGKGTVFDSWGEMIGAENVSSVPLEAMAREFGTEPLVGKMLNLAGDMNDVDAAAEGTLKAWTGEDRVTVPRKYRPALDVAPGVKFVYACNKLPWFKDKSDGVWRRLLVVPFTFTPTAAENDPLLRPALRAELPGVLNWALAGLARLLKQGGFTTCAVCEAAKVAHRAACSPVGEFIGDHFTLASEYTGPAAGKRWVTTTTEVKVLVKEHNIRFGERVIAPNVVCRELAAMPGVFTRRPKTVTGRTEFGTIYCGVCVGEPRQIVPAEVDEFVNKSGFKSHALGLGAPPPTSGGKKASKKVKGSHAS